MVNLILEKVADKPLNVKVSAPVGYALILKTPKSNPTVLRSLADKTQFWNPQKGLVNYSSACIYSATTAPEVKGFEKINLIEALK